MSVKPALAQKAVEVAQNTEDQGMAGVDMEEEDQAETDAISKRHSDKRTVIIIGNI
jgi:predicted transcriptional regulator